MLHRKLQNLQTFLVLNNPQIECKMKNINTEVFSLIHASFLLRSASFQVVHIIYITTCMTTEHMTNAMARTLKPLKSDLK